VKLANLHEAFIDRARHPMSFGKLPIEPLSSGAVIIPVDKWEKLASPTRLRKTFKFASQEKRNEFVQGLFEYEAKTRHNAMITIDEDKIVLDIRTKDIDQITELDKEYARFADVLFKDVAYSSSTENEF
jgi:hypothetical protein